MWAAVEGEQVVQAVAPDVAAVAGAEDVVGAVVELAAPGRLEGAGSLDRGRRRPAPGRRGCRGCRSRTSTVSPSIVSPSRFRLFQVQLPVEQQPEHLAGCLLAISSRRGRSVILGIVCATTGRDDNRALTRRAADAVPDELVDDRTQGHREPAVAKLAAGGERLVQPRARQEPVSSTAAPIVFSTLRSSAWAQMAPNRPVLAPIDGDRLSAQAVVREGPRGPVERVLERTRDRGVVLRGRDHDCVGCRERRAEAGRRPARRTGRRRRRRTPAASRGRSTRRTRRPPAARRPRPRAAPG